MLSIEKLEDRNCPSVWIYNIDGTVKGKALFEDLQHPGWVYDPRSLVAHPHPTVSGDITKVEAVIEQLPNKFQRWLGNHGINVEVYKGSNVGVLPEFSSISNTQTGANGDGNRTYSNVSAVYADPNVVISSEETWPLRHEVWHGVESRIPIEWIREWEDNIHPYIDWNKFPSGAAAGDYFKYNPGEAFAESGKVYQIRAENLEPIIRNYFDRLTLAVGI